MRASPGPQAAGTGAALVELPPGAEARAGAARRPVAATRLGPAPLYIPNHFVVGPHTRKSKLQEKDGRRRSGRQRLSDAHVHVRGDLLFPPPSRRARSGESKRARAQGRWAEGRFSRAASPPQPLGARLMLLPTAATLERLAGCSGSNGVCSVLRTPRKHPCAGTMPFSDFFCF